MFCCSLIYLVHASESSSEKESSEKRLAHSLAFIGCKICSLLIFHNKAGFLSNDCTIVKKRNKSLSATRFSFNYFTKALGVVEFLVCRGVHRC